MKRRHMALLAGSATIVIIIAAIFSTLDHLGSAVASQHGFRWEAVRSEIPVGKGVRVEVRLVDTDSRPALGAVSAMSARLDMGPDGMKTMAAPLRPASTAEPGVLAFETDIAMAGRWALTITGAVKGSGQPVEGVVVFTAIEKRSDAESAAPVESERRVLYYRDPMGLPHVSPVPKKDSMGMDFIPVYSDEVAGPAGTVRIAPEKIQRAGVRTETVERRHLTRSVRAVGTVVADEGRVAVVTTKFDGFIEELFVPVTGADVQPGQNLLRVWIDGRDMLQKQSDLLVALRGTGGRGGDVERAEANLRQFGIPDRVIQDLRRTREPVRSIVLPAPIGGTVVEKPALNGQRFSAGNTLYKITDLSTVWIIAQVAERDLGALRAGQSARIDFKAFPGESFEGRVSFVYPELNMATRTAQARIVVANKERRIRIGQYADITVESPAASGPVVAVPGSAVIDSGTRRIALVAKGDGVFEPRDLVLGGRGDGYVEAKKGLNEGERVVVRGNFLIDAESNLRAALAAFTAGETKP